MKAPAPSSRRSVALAAGVLAFAGASCSSLQPGVLGLSAPSPSPAPFESYPPWAVCGPVRVEARYYLDQAELMGGDLLEGFHLVPVALRMGVVPTSPEAGRIAAVPGDMRAVLHLADGTALQRVSPDDVDVRRRRMERLFREGFEGGLLPPWETPREGFVYFALPSGARASSADLTVTVTAPGGARTLDLRGSLVSFELTVEGSRRMVHVGLQLDRHGSKLEEPSP